MESKEKVTKCKYPENPECFFRYNGECLAIGGCDGLEPEGLTNDRLIE
jgi:hypothetical protein